MNIMKFQMNDIYMQTYLNMKYLNSICKIIQIYNQYHKDINTIIYCYLIIRLILIFNLYKTNEFNVIKIYDMSQMYIQNEFELYDCSRIEIQVPSSYEKFFLLVFQLISLFIFFHFSYTYIVQQGKISLVSGNKPLFGLITVIFSKLTYPDFLHTNRS